MSPDSRFPELPSDEELGIDGLDLSDPEDHPEQGAPAGGAPAGGEPTAPPKEPRPLPVAGPPPGGGSWIAALLTLAVLLVGVWAASVHRMLPTPAPANAPADQFSSARAMTNLVELARAPRPLGSPEHTRAREWLMARLEELGLEPQLHESLFIRDGATDKQTFLLRNVLARIPGTNPTGALLLMAHYDGVHLSPAAGDDGTGVVVILEALRALQTGPPPTNDIILFFPDGEEIGLLGARAFANEHPWMADVALAINLEMRGAGGAVLLFETGPDNGWVLEQVRASDPSPLAPSFATAVYRALPNDTDLSVFRDAGIQGINLAAASDAWAYHMPTDAPANISEATLQHMGSRTLAFARHFGSVDLSSPFAADRATITLPFVGLLTWPAGWTPLMGAVLLLAWAAMALLALARGGGRPWLPFVVGLTSALILLAISAGAGELLQRLLQPHHPEYGFLTPAFYGEVWYMAALAAACVGFALFLVAYAPREGRYPVLVGAAFVPVAVAVGLTFALPLAAPPFLVGAAAGLLAILGRGVLPGSVRVRPFPAWSSLVLVLIPALVVLFALVPVVQLLFEGLGMQMAAAVGVAITLLLLVLLPALEPLAYPSRFWAPAAALSGAALLLFGGVTFAGANEDRPLPTTLFHTHSHTTGDAFFVTQEGIGTEWAESVVGEFPITGLPSGAATLPISPTPRGGGFLSAPVPGPLRIDFPQPEVSWEFVEPGVLRVSIRSAVGAEILRLGSPTGLLEFNSLNGRPLGPFRSGAVTRLRHQGPAGEPIEVELRLKDQRDMDIPLELEIIEEHMRPGELLGHEWFRRSPGYMAYIYAGSDRSWLRSFHLLQVDGSGGVALSPLIPDDTPAPEEAGEPPTPRDL